MILKGDLTMNINQLENKLCELTPSEIYHREHPGSLSRRYNRIEKKL